MMCGAHSVDTVCVPAAGTVVRGILTAADPAAGQCGTEAVWGTGLP